MIRLDPALVQGVRVASSAEDLHRFLQDAIKLEHATIPLYLTAYFSLKPGINDQVAKIIRSVVVEEMLHLLIGANVLNAVGGHPVFDDSNMVPHFPGSLPGGVDSDLELHLARMSDEQNAAFMSLEEPEDDIEIRLLADEPEFETIGTFYAALIDKIRELGEAAFEAPSAPQVTSSWFGSAELFPVTDVATAVAALQLIVRQGEGTSTSPVDAEGDPAHYYRFREIEKRKRLVANPAAPHGFSFTGDPVDFEPTMVWPLIKDPKPDRYDPGTLARRLVDTFNRSYTRLLKALHTTVNGRPEDLDAAFGIMYEMRLLALQTVSTRDPEDPTLTVTPTWLWLDPAG
ncbi:MAG: hypothetical protein QOD63_314 [Actinomycetota bacterium]|nr:hypothetical protein [Actinomycetota bacterium]